MLYLWKSQMKLQLLNCHKGIQGVELETTIQLCSKALPASGGGLAYKGSISMCMPDF